VTVTFHVEPWGEFKRESLYLWPRHWEEIALDRDKIKLNIDYSQYDELDRNGALHVVVARNEGRIIGYWLTIIRPHLHYADSLTAFTDVYYIAPEFRKGRTGLRLFQFGEKTLKQRGVQKVYTATKIHSDKSKVFEWLGYGRTEVVYTKFIGDKEWSQPLLAPPE